MEQGKRAASVRLAVRANAVLWIAVALIAVGCGGGDERRRGGSTIDLDADAGPRPGDDDDDDVNVDVDPCRMGTFANARSLDSDPSLSFEDSAPLLLAPGKKGRFSLLHTARSGASDVYHLYLNEWDGDSWVGRGEPVNEVNGESKNPDSYAIASDGKGTTALVWTTSRPPRVEARIRKNDEEFEKTVVFEEASYLSSATGGQIALGPEGDALAVWTYVDSAYKRYGRTRVYRDGEWGPVENLPGVETDPHMGLQGRPVIDENGTMLIVWNRENEGPSYNDILVSRRQQGSSWGTARPFETLDSMTYAADVVNDEAGSTWVAWVHHPTNDTRDVGTLSVRRFDVENQAWDRSIEISTDIRSHEQPLRFLRQPEGDLVIVYRETDAGLVQRRLENGASGWGEETVISADVGYYDRYIVDSDPRTGEGAVLTFTPSYAIGSARQAMNGARLTGCNEWQPLRELDARDERITRAAVATRDGQTIAVWSRGDALWYSRMEFEE